MTPEILLLIGIAVATLGLLAFEVIAADVIALGMLLALTLTGLLPAEKAFSGFGSDTFIIILGLLILTAALARTGVIDLTGRAILRHTGKSGTRLLVVVVLTVAAMSAFMSNTAAVAFFLPMVFGLAQRAQVSPGKLLMPLAFAGIITSSVTLISTSTNVVVSGLMRDYGLPPMGMFELAPVGVPISIAGVLYLLTLGRKLIPDRFADGEHGAVALGLRPYLAEIVILPDSPLVGKTLAKSNLGHDLDLTVLRVVRQHDQYLWPHAHLLLQAGDLLIVEGSSDEILKIKDIAGIEIKADVKLSDPGLSPEELGLVEVLVMPGSPLIGRTLKYYGFRERYGLQVLGISRHGEVMHRKLSLVPLRIGDVLLLQGPRERFARIERDRTFRIIGVPEEERPRIKLAPVAIGIFAAVIALPTLKLLSLPVAVMLGVLAVFLTRCIRSDEAYAEVEWRAVILIGAMLSLGVAMEHTGSAKYLAERIIAFAGHLGPVALLSAFFGFAVLLTQLMSNQAAAIVLLPVAIQTANQLGLNPRTFAMMIAVASSCSYLTPLEPACLMVYGPGRYRFRDFTLVGAPLTLIIFLLAITLVPRCWPVR
jgi:di/tricarboxylate transporter